MLLAQRGWYEVDPGKASKGPTGIWPRGQTWGRPQSPLEGRESKQHEG